MTGSGYGFGRSLVKHASACFGVFAFSHLLGTLRVRPNSGM